MPHVIVIMCVVLCNIQARTCAQCVRITDPHTDISIRGDVRHPHPKKYAEAVLEQQKMRNSPIVAYHVIHGGSARLVWAWCPNLQLTNTRLWQTKHSEALLRFCLLLACS